MKNLLVVIIFAVVLGSTMNCLAQNNIPVVPATVPTSAVVIADSQKKNDDAVSSASSKVLEPPVVYTQKPAPTPELATKPFSVPNSTLELKPDESSAEPEKRCELSGGIDFVSRYHGDNGYIFRNAFDQHAYLQLGCKVKPNVTLYGNVWGALQYHEIDFTVGAKVDQGKWTHTFEYAYLIFPGTDASIRVHGFSYEAERELKKAEKFTAKAFARFEYYKVPHVEDLRSGSYLFAGVRTETELGKGWTWDAEPKVLIDANGAFDAQKGSVLLFDTSLLKKYGKIYMGPGFIYSQNLTSNDRPRLFTFRWSISF